jgi:hypothetical protein
MTTRTPKETLGNYILDIMYRIPMVQPKATLCKCNKCVNELRATIRMWNIGVA